MPYYLPQIFSFTSIFMTALPELIYISLAHMLPKSSATTAYKTCMFIRLSNTIAIALHYALFIRDACSPAGTAAGRQSLHAMVFSHK